MIWSVTSFRGGIKSLQYYLQLIMHMIASFMKDKKLLFSVRSTQYAYASGWHRSGNGRLPEMERANRRTTVPFPET